MIADDLRRVGAALDDRFGPEVASALRALPGLVADLMGRWGLRAEALRSTRADITMVLRQLRTKQTATTSTHATGQPQEEGSPRVPPRPSPSGPASSYALSSIERPVLGLAGRQPPRVAEPDVRFVHQTLRRLNPLLPPTNGVVIVVGNGLLIRRRVRDGWSWPVLGA